MNGGGTAPISSKEMALYVDKTGLVLPGQEGRCRTDQIAAFAVKRWLLEYHLARRKVDPNHLASRSLVESGERREARGRRREAGGGRREQRAEGIK